MTAEREPWCWLCGDPDSCDMCKPDEPGQLGLFANEVLIEQDLADEDADS